jgi:HPt (histidine-containing phosphotransfer) domain-containing protein
VAHTVKGAALGIGANALGAVCQTAEFGTPDDLPAVRAALAVVVADIVAYEAAKAKS